MRAATEFDYRLLGLEVADGAERLPYWLLASDRFDWWLAYKGMFKSAGLSPVWLAKQFRGRAPALLHVHYGPPAAQLTHFAKALDRPMVVSFYGYDATKASYTDHWLWRMRYRRVFEEAAAFIAEGPAMSRRLAALGCPQNKIHVVRLPADESALAPCVRREGQRFRGRHGWDVHGEEGLRHRHRGLRPGARR